jgi:hypothetical protein
MLQRGNLPIHEAFRNGHAHIVSWFLEVEPDLVAMLVKECNNDGMTAVNMATMMRRSDFNSCVKMVTGLDMSLDTEQDQLLRRIADARNL